MESHLLSWLNLATRWFHVIVGIAWIGTSFYFNWLNDQLRPPEEPAPGVGGELWSVHGGGFYRVTKFTVAPEHLPQRLHWFKWEAYATWLSGMVLLTLVYYLQAGVYLLDPAVSAIKAPAAIGLSLATLAAGWLGYHALASSPLARHDGWFAAVGLVLVTGVAWALTRVLSSRAAYLDVGAMLGTIMAANVFFVIIPSQKVMVDAMAAGREPDAARGHNAARRSRHNNYLTLPVVFVMISNHYSMTYGSEWNWAILAGLFVVGFGVRHFFNQKNRGRRPWWLLPAAVVALIALAVITAPAPPRAAGSAGEASFTRVQGIIAQRCTRCHSAEPTYPGIPFAPAGVMFDTPEQILAKAARIQVLAVDSHTMPLGNATGMTDEERAILGRWIAGGAGR